MNFSETIVICEPFEEVAPSRREGAGFCERCGIDVAISPELMRAIGASGPEVLWRYLCRVCHAHRPPARAVRILQHTLTF
jgi:hypothetical protein